MNRMLLEAFAAVRASAGRQTARVLLTLSLVGRAAGGLLSASYAGFGRLLDLRVFPAIVRYATHRLHITALLLLGVVLMVSNSAVVQFKGGNYTNITSALVSCVVLMQQLKHQRENKRLHAENAQLHTQHADAIAALHAKVNALAAPASPAASPAPTQQRRPKRTLATAITAQSSEVGAS